MLFIVFGSFLAMTLPLLTAGVSLGTGIAVIGLLSNVINMASFANELALLIGLGVGVDYALFIVTRYRQGLLRGMHREDAAVESLDTSGRAVLFAGMIVCIAMLGMFALGVSFLYGVAVAAAVAVAFTVLAALTLLPAMLGIFGRLVLRRRERRRSPRATGVSPTSRRAWARWTDWMQKRPAVFAGAATLLMIVIAIPFLSMRLGFGRRRLRPDEHDDPQGVRPARRGLRSRLQRTAPARRPGLDARPEGRVPAHRPGRLEHARRRQPHDARRSSRVGTATPPWRSPT